MIEVELAYLTPERQHLESLQVSAGSTIHQVINQSSLVEEFPDLDVRELTVGIFAKEKKLSDVVKPGDRVEIYRPLICDPKQARRTRG